MHAKEQRGLVNMRRTRQSKNRIQEKQMILLDVLGFIETYKWNSNALKQTMSSRIRRSFRLVEIRLKSLSQRKAMIALELYGHILDQLSINEIYLFYNWFECHSSFLETFQQQNPKLPVDYETTKNEDWRMMKL